MGDSGTITGARAYASMVTVVVVAAVAIVSNLCEVRESRNQENHMANVTWRAGRLAVWFSWKWQMQHRLRHPAQK